MLTNCDDPISFDVPDGWECFLLDQLADDLRGISYGIVQPGQHVAGGVPIVRVNNLRNGRIDSTEMLCVSSDVESKYERTRLRGGEVLLSLVGTLGECAVVPEKMNGWNVARAVGVISLKPGTDPRWVAYCLRSAAVQTLMKAWATTTVQATLNLRDVRRLPILLAPEKLRSAITETLGALDDKIEQNRRTAQALEKLARAIFRAWFLDFEPVKAKAAGATSFPSMPQPVFDALPTRLVDSAIGPVPEGWGVKPLSEVCTLVSGGTPRRSESSYWGGGIPWYSVRDAPCDGNVWVTTTAENISEAGLANSAARLLPKGGTIISARGTVGKIAMAGTPLAFNQSCYGLLPTDEQAFGYLYQLVQSAVGELQQRTHGSVFDTITRATFDALMVVSPGRIEVSGFTEVVGKHFELMLALKKESAKLAQMRDYLLPGLLGGAVRVEAGHG